MRYAFVTALALAAATPAWAAPQDVPTAATVSRYLQRVQYGQCPAGAVQCFNGWVRQCQVRGNTTLWITGARRC